MSQGFRLASLLLPAVLVPIASSQTPQDNSQTTFTLNTSTRLVVLDVVVLDKQDKPVRGLDRSQFTVTEDKLPQTVRSFEAHDPEEHSSDKPIHGTAELRKLGGTRPADIVVFDELNSKFEEMSYAREMMERYLKRQPETLPVPMQMVAAGDAKFVVLKDYTQSRQELLDALHTHLPQYPWQMMRNQGGNGALERMAQTLGILDQIADASSGTAGRKNVVWLGTGYPAFNTTEMGEEDQAKILPAIKTVTARMMASRITLYVVDPTGVHGVTQDDGSNADGDPTAEVSSTLMGPFNGPMDFTSFSAATGGAVFSERNDLDHEMDEGLREAATYYTLTYTPTSTSDADAKYRNIRVLMKDKSLHAVTRNGYFPGPQQVEKVLPKGQKSNGQVKWDIAAAAQTELVYSGLDVRPKETENGFELDVVAKDLTWKDQGDGSRVAEVTAMAVFYDSKGKQAGHQTRQLKERIQASDAIQGGQRAAFALAFDVPAKTSRIRFVVRDAENGKIGSANLPLK